MPALSLGVARRSISTFKITVSTSLSRTPAVPTLQDIKRGRLASTLKPCQGPPKAPKVWAKVRMLLVVLPQPLRQNLTSSINNVLSNLLISLQINWSQNKKEKTICSEQPIRPPQEAPAEQRSNQWKRLPSLFRKMSGSQCLETRSKHSSNDQGYSILFIKNSFY